MKLNKCELNPIIYQSHSLYGSVDWNKPYQTVIAIKVRHSLHGSVDWNLVKLYRLFSNTWSHSLHGGVWIEIIKRYFSKEDLNMSLFSWLWWFKWSQELKKSEYYLLVYIWKLIFNIILRFYRRINALLFVSYFLLKFIEKFTLKEVLWILLNL